MQLVWHQIRGRWIRSVALLLGVIVATSGFTLLTGLSTSAKLETVGTVDKNFRAAYDVLVRPSGNRSDLETSSGRVRPNFLSGVYGGITLDQLHTVSTIDGVDVAAPVAMLGSASIEGEDQVDLTAMVDRTRDQQVLRMTPTWNADDGLTQAAEPSARFVYVTKRQLIFPIWVNNGGAHYPPTADPRAIVPPGCFQEGPPVLEVEPDGHQIALCEPYLEDDATWRGFNPNARDTINFAQLLPDGQFRTYPGIPYTGPKLIEDVAYPEMLQMAAIDPVQEAKLVGLGSAVTSGRYLTESDPVTDALGMPLLASSQPYLSGSVTVHVDQLSGASADAVPIVHDSDTLRNVLSTAPGRAVGAVTTTAQTAYATAMADSNGWVDTTTLMQAAEPTYTQAADGTLTPNTVSTPDQEWQTQDGYYYPPWLTQDTGFRAISKQNLLAMGDMQAFGTVVGTFDPTKLTDFSPLATVPLETYQPPSATGADAASRAALKNSPLLPSGTPDAYLSSPALLLTTIAALPKILPTALLAGYAPISSIRVRVAGVTGIDPVSRERVRLVADQIEQSTGLDVDITIGSSPERQKVVLPAGVFGRPQLTLTEDWSKLGVATVIVAAANRKSVLLSGLVLVVCVLFLGNAVSAAVRDRKTQLALLACLGWSRWHLLRLNLAEISVVGIAGGAVAIGINAALAAPLGVHLPLRSQATAFGVAIAITVLAGIVPAFRGSRTRPIGAVTDLSNTAGNPRARRSVLSLALVDLLRVPGRSLLAVIALAIGVGGVTLVSAILAGFRSTVVGTVLGDAVSLQVRPVDIAAVACTLLLSAAAVADVLFINVREQSPRYALLLAVGWTRAHVARLVLTQAVALGILGALVGTGLALYGLDRITGTVPHTTWTVMAIAGIGGIVTACIAAIAPAAMLDRIPIAALLSRD